MVDGMSGIGSSLTSAYSSGGVMGKEDFLKLLLTQMKNQDPLSPLDGSQFASQLAQFSSLEQLVNLNSAVKTSIDADYYLSQSINNTLASTLIGKDVKLDRNSFQSTGQDEVTLGYNLPKSAKSVTVKVYNESGALVKTFDPAPGMAGDNKLTWDFKDNNGNTVARGNYTFKVEATDANDKTLSASLFILGRIDGIKFSENGTKLILGGFEYSLADILEILNPSNGG